MSMEFLMATGIGALTAAGLYLILLRRTFPVVVGLSFLSYAVNVFLFTMGRLTIDRPPIVDPTQQGYTDPLPQALVLTAIVITIGMTALIVVLSLRAFLETGNDDVTLDVAPEPETSGRNGAENGTENRTEASR